MINPKLWTTFCRFICVPTNNETCVSQRLWTSFQRRLYWFVSSRPRQSGFVTRLCRSYILAHVVMPFMLLHRRICVLCLQYVVTPSFLLPSLKTTQNQLQMLKPCLRMFFSCCLSFLVHTRVTSAVLWMFSLWKPTSSSCVAQQSPNFIVDVVMLTCDKECPTDSLYKY